ncbi:MAG: hypothetical protein QG597_4675 [Actinomycetota bacterium]|nr:hypothetical protein [Actinomycetota bacterium]
MSALPDWIADPALGPVWDRIWDRFEKAGLEPVGGVRVAAATREQRHALGDLLGRPLTGGTVRIDLAVLDERLAERSGVGGLGEVLGQLYGRAPQSRPAARAARAEARELPLALAAELFDPAWSAEVIGWLRDTGVLTARADSERIVRDAATVLAELTGSAADGPLPARTPPAVTDGPLPTRTPPAVPGGPQPTRSRVELGATLLGDAHALDRDRVLHAVVLRGLAAAVGVAVPGSTGDREELWARFGVQPDVLSRTCLAWRLRSTGAGPTDRRVNEACAAGDPIHLTEWDLRRLAEVHPGADGPVLVCENPRVVEAFAEIGVVGWSAVCTAGEPNLVVARVLGQLATAGAELLYHGDFDWAGLAIANRVIERAGARPWLMSAGDYSRGVRDDGPRLIGHEVVPSWDRELGDVMRSHGRAVHEESVLAELLAVAEDWPGARVWRG